MAQRGRELVSPEITRRDLLKAASATALTGCIQTRRSLEMSDPYGGLKVGVHSYSLRNFSFDEMVAITRDLGVGYVGVNRIHVPIESPADELSEKKRAIEAAGLYSPSAPMQKTSPLPVSVAA